MTLPLRWVVCANPHDYAETGSCAFLDEHFNSHAYYRDALRNIVLVCAPTDNIDPWQWAVQLSALRTTKRVNDKPWPHATEVWVLSTTAPLDTYPVGYMFYDTPTSSPYKQAVTPVSPP